MLSMNARVTKFHRPEIPPGEAGRGRPMGPHRLSGGRWGRIIQTWCKRPCLINC